MDKSLLDTDVFSEVLRGRNPVIMRRWTAYIGDHGRLTLSTPTVAEVVRGYQRLRHTTALQRFLQRLSSTEVLPLEEPAAVLAGRIAGDLEAMGRPIGLVDPLIAAIALHHNLVLVTGNVAHFQRIQSLGYPRRLDNWREA